MSGFKSCDGHVPFRCLDDDETVMFFERFHGILVCSKCCQQFSLRNAGISPWQECGIKNIKGETHNLEMFQSSKCFNSNPDKLCTNIKEGGDKCVDIWQIALIPAAWQIEHDTNNKRRPLCSLDSFVKVKISGLVEKPRNTFKIPHPPYSNALW